MHIPGIISPIHFDSPTTSQSWTFTRFPVGMHIHTECSFPILSLLKLAFPFLSNAMVIVRFYFPVNVIRFFVVHILSPAKFRYDIKIRVSCILRRHFLYFLVHTMGFCYWYCYYYFVFVLPPEYRIWLFILRKNRRYLNYTWVTVETVFIDE